MKELLLLREETEGDVFWAWGLVSEYDLSEMTLDQFLAMKSKVLREAEEKALRSGFDPDLCDNQEWFFSNVGAHNGVMFSATVAKVATGEVMDEDSAEIQNKLLYYVPDYKELSALGRVVKMPRIRR